jgi:hypothetical protein
VVDVERLVVAIKRLAAASAVNNETLRSMSNDH